MLPNLELIQSLDDFEILFQIAVNRRASLMHAKHAFLELCGWIEEAQDYIVLSCAKKLSDPVLKKLVEEKIKFNSAFHFQKNFVPLLALVIGLTKYGFIVIFTVNFH